MGRSRMERRLRWEDVMTIEVLHERGVSNRAIAQQLGVHEHTVRYRPARQASARPDGRASQVCAATLWAAAIGEWTRAAEAGPGTAGRCTCNCRSRRGPTLALSIVVSGSFPSVYAASWKSLRGSCGVRPRSAIEKRSV